jgi:ATP-dependent Clp protease ATP-binding subunit ClpX
MNSPDQNYSCSFCGKGREQVNKLIAGPTAFICDECIRVSANILDDTDIHNDDINMEDIPTPASIFDTLGRTVIGQSTAKKILSIASYNHYKRMNLVKEDHVIGKTNILMVGPTGSGKTLLAQTLAKTLRVPFAIADATTLTEAGYVGEDVESVIERLLNSCDWDVNLAQSGIVFIDEIDKKSRSSESNSSTKDISGEGVQQALLRLIEGTTVKVPLPNSRKSDSFVEFDTSNVLFVCSGAFVGLEKTVTSRINKRTIGFGADISNTQTDTWRQQITHKDLISYGLIPEFVGRLSTIVSLDELTEDDMISIMTSSDVSVIKESKQLLELDNIELNFSQEYFKNVSKIAHSNGTGARGIRSIVEASLHSIMFRAPELNKDGVIGIIFDSYPQDKETQVLPTLVYSNGVKQTDEHYSVLLRGQIE